MTDPRPVERWDTDFDVLSPTYIEDPFSIWDELRRTCPVAHSDRRGSTWLPTRYRDVVDVAHNVEGFSSSDITVIPLNLERGDQRVLQNGLPPLSADPPLHTWTRRILLPWFSHQRVDSYELFTRKLCGELLDGFIADGTVDAGTEYARQIPVRVIADILGVPVSMSHTFTGWVQDILEFTDEPAIRRRGIEGLVGLFSKEVERRKPQPGDDLLSDLLHTEVDGVAVEEGVVLGIAALVLIAGIDTTWSAIGSSLWHLATHPEDRDRLVADPGIMPTAIEEFLRAYSPVTTARVVTEDVEFARCPMKAGDKVLMSFPAANRDPEAFEDADRVIIDRDLNRHVAFGSGIHRCAGSNLARIQIRVALEEWLQRIPTFRLADAGEVTWSGGRREDPTT